MSKESEKLYNGAFLIGFLFTAVLFEIANFVAYYIALNKYNKYLQNLSQMASSYSLPHFPDWGFPFYWDKDYLAAPIVGSGGIFNLIFLAVCGYIVGLLFRFLWSKPTSQN